MREIGGTMSGVFSSAMGEPVWQLALLAGLVCVLAGLLVASLLRRARARQSDDPLRQQNTLLDAALNNMSQGLCMFNAEEEIVVFNRRFLELYRRW
jgi:PAS domain-containing protein